MPEISKPTAAIEVFFSYSHRDEELRDELSKHLAMLKRRHVITGWHDRKIGAGKEWESEIDHHLDTADVILLLISSDFLASEYCYDVEVRRAMARHDAREVRVIPVILRPVDWKGAPFGRLQALPKDAKPITTWANRDDAFLNVAEGIRAAIEELTIGKIGYLMEKLDRAGSLGNWPNVIDLGERILKTVPEHQSIRSKTAETYLKRWSRYLGELNDIGQLKVRTKRHENIDEIMTRMTADLSRAIELDPENAEYYFIRGALKGSAADLTRAIEIDPRAAKYYYARGCQGRFENNEAGLHDLQRALDLGYAEVEIRSARGSIYYHGMKDYKSALSEYQRAAELGHPVGRMMVRKISGS
ncbi:MAG: toll/interleukin-1 receptor domain-containing protein [Gammaproteobacteria bacterium]